MHQVKALLAKGMGYREKLTALQLQLKEQLTKGETKEVLAGLELIEDGRKNLSSGNEEGYLQAVRQIEEILTQARNVAGAK